MVTCQGGREGGKEGEREGGREGEGGRMKGGRRRKEEHLHERVLFLVLTSFPLTSMAVMEGAKQSTTFRRRAAA